MRLAELGHSSIAAIELGHSGIAALLSGYSSIAAILEQLLVQIRRRRRADTRQLLYVLAPRQANAKAQRVQRTQKHKECKERNANAQTSLPSWLQSLRSIVRRSNSSVDTCFRVYGQAIQLSRSSVDTCSE